MLTIAQLSDIPVLKEFARELHKESKFSHLQLDESRVDELATQFIVFPTPDRVTIVMLDNDNPVGIILGAAEKGLFNHDKIGFVVLFALKPEYRTFPRANELLKGFEFWAGFRGCKHISVASLSPKMDKFFKHKGYVAIESAHVKEL